MKKSIVLLTTILFMAAISLLILKNLEDTNSYISVENSKFTKTQILYYINNSKVEVTKLLSKNFDREILKEFTEFEYPILFQDANISIKLKEYDRYNINLLKEKDEKKYENFKNFLQRNDVYDIYTLKNILIEFENINNNKQLNSLLDKFEKESYKADISKIKDYIGFIDYDKKEFFQNENEKDIKFYELFVKVSYLNEFAKAYYILDKTGGVKYFEYSFK